MSLHCFLFVLQSYNFTDLKPFTPYKLGIMAYNSVGDGPVRNILNVWTKEGGWSFVTTLFLTKLPMLLFEWNVSRENSSV